MEEKERYEWRYSSKIMKHYIFDNLIKTQIGYEDITNLLNQQDKRIKELEEENGYIVFADGYDENGNQVHKQIYKTYKEGFKELVDEKKKLQQQLKQQLHDLPKKIVENTKLKIEKLYLELLLTRLQWIHKRADDCRLEKERFGGIEDMALDSAWRVLDLQQHECCNYEEMCELDDGIKCIANDELLRDIEHNLQFKVSRSENEIFEEIAKLDTILKKYGDK